MRCPFCGATDARVVDTRDVSGGIRRRRECSKCRQRFTTYERIATVNLLVVKRDERREKFERDKLVSSMQTACGKRPVPAGVLEEVAREIEADLYAMGVAEVESRIIGELVMKRLRQIDGVAYVRFASVYRQFADVDRMIEEIESLKVTMRRQEELRDQMELPLQTA